LGAFLTTIVTGLAFASLVRLRRREPELHRPYKAWGYPFSAYLTIVVTIALFIGFALSDYVSLLVVLGIIACSYPFYKLLSRLK
jgi:basic amino acid/polyamine antiporter, APA family